MNKYSEKEWEELAAILSGEKNYNSKLLERFTGDDSHDTERQWKDLGKMKDENEIDVNKAWENVSSRLKNSGLMSEASNSLPVFRRIPYFRLAAAITLLIAIGSIFVIFNEKGVFNREVSVVTGDNQKNLQVTLDDGSLVTLNRNTTLSYRRDFKKHPRKVILRGEAFFEITPGMEKPFEINAGTALVKVMGTSFNVITSNAESAVEVFVQTGKVSVTSNDGSSSLVLEPGYIGTMTRNSSAKYVNQDHNYLAWTNGILIYDGQKLEVVFRDLKKVYNMEITTDDPEILNYTWTTNGPLDNLPEETIIRIICLSFNLSYSKADNIYHLSKNN